MMYILCTTVGWLIVWVILGVCATESGDWNKYFEMGAGLMLLGIIGITLWALVANVASLFL